MDKLRKIILSSLVLLSTVAPVAAQATTTASGGCQLTDFKSVVTCTITNIVNPLVYLVMGVAVLALLWGVVQYITKGDKPEERKKGGQFIMYGVIGLFVMISVWGLVAILSGTFFPSGPGTQPPVPTIQL